MECPKCGINISDDALTCPNCKKVLKLKCPICGSINTTNTCQECGYIIISKCHQCSKMNPTIQGKCSKCGFDTHVSAILGESNIEEFACATIDFPNMEEMKAVFGARHLYEKFKLRINNLIYDYSKKRGLKRGKFGDTYVIRFNKDYTYSASVNNAVKSSIDILNLITQMNAKLTKAKDTQLKCNIAILKRDIHSFNDDYKSGININLIYKGIDKNKLIKNLQLLVDGSVYEVIGKNYPLESVGMTRAKNRDLLFWELNLTGYINVDDTEDKEQDNSSVIIPSVIEDDKEIFEIEDSIYDIEGISFDEIHCNFRKEMTQGIAGQIAQMFISSSKGITVVKGKREYLPRTYEVIEKIKQNNIFNSIIEVTCTTDLKYKPYGFFYDLISGIFGFSTTGKNKEYNNFQNTAKFDSSDLLEKFINFNIVDTIHPEDVRKALFTIFEQILVSKQKLLLIIENMDKIDDSSYELLKTMMHNLEKYNISYLIIADKNYSLHKDAHFLLSKREYTEITLKPTPIKNLIEVNSGLCKNILNTFYMQKISKNTKGSPMYFMQALLHLMDLGIFVVEKGSLVQAKSETVLFPTTLDELIQRKLLYIKQSDENLFKLLACILIIGPQLDLQTIKYFNNPNIDDYLKYLDSKGFIYSTNGFIQVQNYELYLDNIIKIMTNEEIRAIANYLITYFYKENDVNPALAKLYSIVNSTKNEFVQWENLSNINRSLGDFSAYFSCSKRFLKLLKTSINDSSTKSFEEYQIEVYENIANLLYKYTPEKITDITNNILENYQASKSDKRASNLFNKILQGCLISGNYVQAILMVQKLLANMQNTSYNPQLNNFDVHNLVVSLQKVEILFNLGELENCIEAGEDIFNNLKGTNLDSIKPKTMSSKNFSDLIFDSAGYVILAKILQLKSDVKNFYRLAQSVLPMPSGYRILFELEKLIHGMQIDISDFTEQEISNKFSASIYNIISAFQKIRNNDIEAFAEEIYRAKLKAKEYNIYQIELFCDLMIGKSYTALGKYTKAATILNSVMETAQKTGMQILYYLSVYCTVELYTKNDNFDTAYGLTSNTIISLEQDSATSPYMIMIFKSLYAKVLKIKKELDQAEICYNQALQIANTYNIKINK